MDYRWKVMVEERAIKEKSTSKKPRHGIEAQKWFLYFAIWFGWSCMETWTTNLSSPGY